MRNGNIKIVLADDHKIMRKGLRALIDSHSDLTVVEEADNGRIAVELARKLLPDVVIMDVTMPDLNGIEATRQIIAELPHTKVIALSMHFDKEFVIAMLKVGAMGYLLKDCAVEELICAIRAVMNNKIYLSRTISDIVIDDYMRSLSKDEVSILSTLTGREREVLQLIAEGKTTKEIASCLHVSINTIDTHRRQVMEKLDMHSIAELTKYAVRKGLTPLEG